MERNYPTRMHEILGVEPFERFGIVGISGHFFLTNAGQLASNEAGLNNGEWIYCAINNGVTRKPRLTCEQILLLQSAQRLLGAKWLAVDEDGGAVLFKRKPGRENNEHDMDGYWSDQRNEDTWPLPASSPLASLTTWERGPVEIEKLLREDADAC